MFLCTCSTNLVVWNIVPYCHNSLLGNCHWGKSELVLLVDEVLYGFRVNSSIVSCALWVLVEFVLLEHYVMLISLDRDLEFWL